MQQVSVHEVISRLKTIENEVSELLGKLEPLASRLHHAEDVLLESVLGTTTGAGRSGDEEASAENGPR